MACCAPAHLVLLSAAILVVAGAAAQSPAPGSLAESEPAGEIPSKITVTPQTQAQIRVYEGFGTLGPLYDHRGSVPYAVDVGVDLTVCADGNAQITGLRIGGWQYRLGATCPEAGAGRSQGSVTVRQTGADKAPAGAPEPGGGASAGVGRPAAGPVPHVIRCNPNTWSCGRATQ